MHIHIRCTATPYNQFFVHFWMQVYDIYCGLCVCTSFLRGGFIRKYASIWRVIRLTLHFSGQFFYCGISYLKKSVANIIMLRPILILRLKIIIFQLFPKHLHSNCMYLYMSNTYIYICSVYIMCMFFFVLNFLYSANATQSIMDAIESNIMWYASLTLWPFDSTIFIQDIAFIQYTCLQMVHDGYVIYDIFSFCCLSKAKCISINIELSRRTSI